jgi:hypothetical protein
VSKKTTKALTDEEFEARYRDETAEALFLKLIKIVQGHCGDAVLIAIARLLRHVATSGGEAA